MTQSQLEKGGRPGRHPEGLSFPVRGLDTDNESEFVFHSHVR